MLTMDGVGGCDADTDAAADPGGGEEKEVETRGGEAATGVAIDGGLP